MDKFSNTNSPKEICDISKIYSDKQDNQTSCLKPNKINQSKNSTFITNNAKTMDTNTNIIQNENKTSELISYFNQDSSKIKCALCDYNIEKGDIIYHCNCDTFIHSICYIKNQEEKNIKICPKCNCVLSLGIFELNQPKNTLNTGIRYYNTKNKENKINNISNKTSISGNDKHGSVNTNILLSTIEKEPTNEKSNICMDTNINGLEDYDNLCDNAADIPLESMIEILNEKDKINDNNSAIKNNIKELNIRSTLINKRNNNLNNKTIIERVALSPITLLNTPYTCNKRKGLNVLTSIPTQFNNNNKNMNYNNNTSINVNNVKRKLTFLSDTKTENKINTNEIDKTPNSSILNISNSNSVTYSNNSPNSLRNLDFNDITNEEINEEEYEDNEDDKENNPPLLKENSKFVRNEDSFDENEDIEKENMKNNLEINISGGISHITSDKKKTVEIPITIEINTINSNQVNYSKETLLIFNTNELNLEQILLILRIFNDKMGKDDKIYSNIFKSGEGLTKDHINYILNIKDNNYTEIFKETEKINYEKISTLIEYAIDLSMNSLSNIFSVLLINDIDEINTINGEYSLELKRILNKLESSKVNLLKYFSITSIILDNQGTEIQPKNKTEKNVNFLSYLYDLSMMCMGFFYTPKNLDELIKSIYLYCCNLEQYSLLNVKLIIKGNQDPSVYLEALNYPINKINHNDFEIIIGPLLKKEKKIINLIATIILNNPEINLILPLMDVSCEFLSKKNNNQENQNIFKERTDFYRLNIPIIPRPKKINISYSVILRNIISKTAQRISKSIDYFRNNDYENALINIYEAKDIFDKNMKNQQELIKKIQIILDCKNNNNIEANNIIQNLNWNVEIRNANINNINFSLLDNSSFDINNNSFIHNSNNEKNKNLVKIGHFIHAIEKDLNLCIDIIKNKNLRLICQLFAIQQSLSFYRVVIFDDDRFLEDNYLNMN